MITDVLPENSKVKVVINISPKHLRLMGAFCERAKLRSIDQAFEYAIEDLCGVNDAEGN